MASAAANIPLIDLIRPSEADGPVISVILSTYSLSLDQPNFFEQDFLPTLFGLGGVRDRGYANPLALERKLAGIYCGLICDVTAVSQGTRPSLRIEVLPVGQRVHHAKVILIQRKRLIRLIVSSANLTHEGFRRQREIVFALDCSPDSSVSASVVTSAITEWKSVLGNVATPSLLAALDGISQQAEDWGKSSRTKAQTRIAVRFGGGPKPLWQSLVDEWPEDEPVLRWLICSPFWPSATGGQTPFEMIADGLIARGARLTGASIDIIASSDSPGERGHARFPFELLTQLRRVQFPVQTGRILPARLDALPTETPEGKAEDQRPLHGKWVLLQGPRSIVVLLGSANFTRKGLGVVSPEQANLESCVLLRCAAHDLNPDDWIPPISTEGIVDWGKCGAGELGMPAQEDLDSIPWPSFISRIEISLSWQQGPSPTGELIVVLDGSIWPSFSLMLPGEISSEKSSILLRHDADRMLPHSKLRITLDGFMVTTLLARRMVVVQWGDPASVAAFPINITEDSKSGLPSILGARPDEQQLLAYFHGRISEDDLLDVLCRQATQSSASSPLPVEDPTRYRELQSYIVREFVESLFGMKELLNSASGTVRSFDHALTGEFSPISLAEQILHAFMVGRRSPVATAFQLTELIALVSNLKITREDLTAKERIGFEEVQAKGVDRLFALVGEAARHDAFMTISSDNEYREYLVAVLSPTLAERWLRIAASSTK